ncbi:hypothetical protein LAZ67_X001898 [Cordylochernes scorpioides]|uniref:DDE-1 domain-containing protein n=1 Tax=Cordylochernes scorpioides TaxID=51811 RepID=A0ABY6LX10_9ARAC|nr:hypothetical protein LAZ67_X001898 [Cordylochernes scorpioides]
MPTRTYIAKSEKNASGFKAAKDRVTLLLCSNASGDRMLKPLLVNRSLKPRALKGKDLNTLPVHWMANKKAWVTTAIFTEWFNKCFAPEVENYMKEMGLEFKILLILDNAPGHLNLEHPNIKIVFFPPNTTSLIQPLDQGIISTFKKYYVKFTFQFIFDKLESDTITVTEVWKQFNILNCVDHVALAIAEIKSQTLNACWKAAWPECVSKRNESNRTTIVTSDIISIAKEIGGEGFDDFGEHDIEELLVDEALSDNDILESMVDTTKDFETVDSELEDVTPLDEKLLREGLQLSGTAHRWYENVEEKINSWDIFVKMFSQNFGHHVTQKDQLAENLKTRAQGEEETSDSYIQDVLHLCREVDPAMMENEIIAHLTKGISEEIYRSMIILDIATIDEFIKWCRKIEASKKKRVNKRVVFDRLPNVAAIGSADSESMEDLVRRIVREEVHRALNPESTTPEPSSLKEIIREEMKKT